MLWGIHPVGTVADCVDIMAAIVERTGIRHLIVMAEGAGDSARTQGNIARLGAEVLPGLRDQVSSRPAPGAG
jgi:DNA-binding transcriptional regulator LsrR (DeoR family)